MEHTYSVTMLDSFFERFKFEMQIYIVQKLFAGFIVLMKTIAL